MLVHCAHFLPQNHTFECSLACQWPSQKHYGMYVTLWENPKQSKSDHILVDRSNLIGYALPIISWIHRQEVILSTFTPDHHPILHTIYAMVTAKNIACPFFIYKKTHSNSFVSPCLKVTEKNCYPITSRNQYTTIHHK